jgi:hypothetical protein
VTAIYPLSPTISFSRLTLLHGLSFVVKGKTHTQAKTPVFYCLPPWRSAVITLCIKQLHSNEYLFIYSLFNDNFSISDYIASNEKMIVNNELERMWKEAVVA